MIISQQDLISQSESICLNIYQKYLKPDDVVFDFGAFKGVLSLAFASLGCKVYSIEASERNYHDLVHNVKDFKNITPILAAIHENDLGEVLTRFNDCIGLEHPLQKITYYTYKSLISKFNLPTPKFIKMDIEGMESVVLRSMEDVFINHRPIVQLSVHDTVTHSIQCVYQKFPGFVPVSRGGYDFNKFFQMDYLAFDLNMNPKSSIGGFEEYILIPKEKYV